MQRIVANLDNDWTLTPGDIQDAIKQIEKQ
jgi:hypothetical protein